MTTWDEREGPILAAIAEADAMGVEPDSDWIETKTGLTPERVGNTVRVLVEADYVAGIDVTSGGDPAPQYIDLRLTRAGREAVGTWSAPALSTNETGLVRLVEVLIASPSDTSDERDRVERAIHDWNALHAAEQRAVLLPRRWERDAHAAMGSSPQAIVNAQIVDRSQILIGVFWTRLGTPTDEAKSGTAEEIGRFMVAGKPVHLYFSDRPATPTIIDTDQLDVLKDYKQELSSQGLLGEFSDSEELARQVTVALTNDVRQLGGIETGAVQPLIVEPPRIEIQQTKSKGSAEVLVRNTGPIAAEKVTVGLEGGLFMHDADGRKVPDNIDRVGSLTPGSSRRYLVFRAGQTTNGRIVVTADDINPVAFDLS